MGKICKLTDERAVTAEMNIEYKKPVPVDEKLLVEGWQVGGRPQHISRGRNSRYAGKFAGARERHDSWI